MFIAIIIVLEVLRVNIAKECLLQLPNAHCSARYYNNKKKKTKKTKILKYLSNYSNIYQHLFLTLRPKYGLLTSLKKIKCENKIIIICENISN